MAVKLQRVTDSHQLLKLVSVTDDAIDWAHTYPKLGKPEDGQEIDPQAIDMKKARYLETHAIGDLVFLDGVNPTVWIFEHPARVDVDRKVRIAWTECLKPGSKSDLWTSIWHDVYLGKEEALDGAPRDEPPRQGDRLTTAFMQLLVDAKVFDELGQAVLDIARRRISTSDSAAAKKK